jgi:hypothetical protein
MKIKVVILVFLCVSLTSCATYYHWFGEDKSSFYTDQEKAILEKTTKAIEFDYGYNDDFNLDYFFPVYQGFTEFKPGDKELSKAVDGMNSETLVSYSEKIYWLQRVAKYKMGRYERAGDWKNYTYIEKYLMPPLNHFSDLLEKQALKRDKSYAGRIEKRKKAIDRKVFFIMRRKEFEDLWKYDYNS